MSGRSTSMPEAINADICSQPEDVRCFIHGGYCRTCASVDEKWFQNNPYPPLFVLISLLGKFTRTLYQIFDRDLVMALVMCEIWQYNFSRYFDRNGHENKTHELRDPELRRKLLAPCNTFSISQVLGVPNETVRRKVKKLVARGWVINEEGELTSSPAMEELFCPNQNAEVMHEFISASRHILSMLRNGKAMCNTAAPQSK